MSLPISPRLVYFFREPMRSSEWLGVHREQIVERWKDRVRTRVGRAASTAWEDRVFACFDQVQRLVKNSHRVCVAGNGVESRLLKCSAVSSDDALQLSAWMLASGRRAIGEVMGLQGGREAKRCAVECGGAIDYLEHTLQVNVCRECSLVGCCMRVQIVEPMPGGLNE